MQIGDLVKTYCNRLYLVVKKRQDLPDAFVVHSLDGKIRQTLSEHLLELVSEGR